MAIATVLKTVVRKDLWVRIPRPPLRSRSRRPRPPTAMLPDSRIRIATVLVGIAFVLIAITVYGMFQTPRPSWSRGLAIPAIVFAVVASSVRRRAGRPD